MDREQLTRLIKYCKAHEVQPKKSFLGAMYNCKKASTIASKLGLYGTNNAQYLAENGHTFLYCDGREVIEFGG